MMSSLIQTGGNVLMEDALRRCAAGGVLLAVLPGVMAAVLLGACAVGPDFSRPAPPAVHAYTHEPLAASSVTADSETQHFTPGAAVPFDWWRLFGSAQLDASMAEALAHNQTLEASEARTICVPATACSFHRLARRRRPCASALRRSRTV
jgi:hypothetical protein